MIDVDNQFGPQTLTIGDAVFLAVPSENAVQPDPLPTPGIVFTIDHYACYAAVGAPIDLTVTLADQFDTTSAVVGARRSSATRSTRTMRAS